MSQLQSQLALFSGAANKALFKGIKHGVEREALRINTDGMLAQTSHPPALGAALCNDYITTDYAEVLMEFITQPHENIDDVITELEQIQHFVARNIGDQQLWPMSMPCYVRDEGAVELAQYGHSNIGQMKTLYREGLRNRYGTMMQLIAGIHFNFSLPDEFWQFWHQQSDSGKSLQAFRSDKYLGLVRNFKRLVWIVPYLYGASPCLCSSFLQGRETGLPFQTLGKGTIYLPYATSLRMSDLGYTNSEQAALNICYNSLETYIEGLRRAIKTPSEKFADIGVKVDGKYRQLNANILQIENEFYSPIRPKQVANTGEKPTDALASRGISYVEVRALDINPFEFSGISRNSFYFLDCFLIYCLLSDSPDLSAQVNAEIDSNLNEVVLQGRQPGLVLVDNGESKTLSSWMNEVMESVYQVANMLDQANDNNRYTAAVLEEKEKVSNPELTPSARLLKHLLNDDLDNGRYALQLAERYKKVSLESAKLDSETISFHQNHAKRSILQQQQIEASDRVDFDAFLTGYFAKPCAEQG